MTLLASSSAIGVAASDNVTVSGTGFAGASTIILGVMVPFPGQTATFPSGFTQLTTANNSGASRGNAAEILFAYGTTVAGSYLLHIGGGGGTTPIGFAIAHTGRLTSTPANFLVSNNVAGSASPVSVGLAGLTPTPASDIVWIGCTNFCPAATSWTWAPPSGYTSQQTQNLAGSAGCSFNVSTLDNQSAATGTLTGVGTNAGATGGADGLGLVIALATAAAAATPGPSTLGFRVFGANHSIPKSVALFMPLAWVIERRQKLAREWKRDDKTGLILPNLKRGLK